MLVRVCLKTDQIQHQHVHSGKGSTLSPKIASYCSLAHGMKATSSQHFGRWSGTTLRDAVRIRTPKLVVVRTEKLQRTMHRLFFQASLACANVLPEVLQTLILKHPSLSIPETPASSKPIWSPNGPNVHHPQPQTQSRLKPQLAPSI